MATLTGKTIADTYTSLLKLEGDTQTLTTRALGDAIQVKTGDDETTPLYLNTDAVGIGTSTPAKSLVIAGSGQQEIHVDAATNAYLLLDAGGNSDKSNVIFQKAGSTVGSIQYFHNATATSESLRIVVNESGSADPQMIVQADGKIGIGTTSPDGQLHITSSTNDKPWVIVEQTSTSQQQGGNILFRNADTDTQLAGEVILGDIVWQGWNTAGTDWESACQIRARKDQATGADNDMGGQLQFYTTADGSSSLGDPRMTIRHTGNVGIGTASPDSLLHLQSSTAGDMIIVESTDTGGTAAPDIVLWRNSSSPADDDYLGFINFKGEDGGGTIHNYATIGAQAVEVANTSEKGDLVFSTSNAGSPTERMRINYTGRVGIGTTSPNYKLEIQDTNANSGGAISLSNSDATIDSANVLGQVQFRGLDGVTTGATGAKILGVAEAEWGVASSTNDAPTSLRFYTQSDGDSADALLAPAMTIDENQNIGIGTTNPLHRFVIKSSTSGASDIPSYIALEDDDAVIHGFIGTCWNVNGGADPGYHFLHMGSSYYNGTNWITNYGTTYGSNNVCQIIQDTDGIRFLTENATGNSQRTDNVTTFNGYERMRVDVDTGNVGIGVTAPTAALHVASDPGDNQEVAVFQNTHSSIDAGDSILQLSFSAQDNCTDGVYINFHDSGGSHGNIDASSSTAVAYNTTSDYRLKENAKTISDALTRVCNLKPYSLNYKGAPGVTIDAFYAHEVQEVVPYVVRGEKDAVDSDGKIDPQMLDHSRLVPLLAAAIQELSTKVTALENA